MKRLTVDAASKRYDIIVGRDCLSGLGKALAEREAEGKIVVCCDENVAPLYLETTRRSLREAGFAVSHIVLPAGEREKNLARAEELYGVLYDRDIRRTDAVVALGGGVMGDLTGFVAATFQRGVGFVQVPTTLLAQVDASVGGKVAVDFRAGKNYVGTFYQPGLVYADLDTLATLPVRELRSGVAEMAKHALLAGGEVLMLTQALAGAPLTAREITEDLVAASISFKARVVEQDEREAGLRAILNLGHTVGHAIEAATGFRKFSHGEAVAFGLRAALRLSVALCGLGEDEEAEGQDLLDKLGLPVRLEGTRPEEVAALVAKDKKSGPEGVGYVLLEKLGSPVRGVAVPEDIELEVVRWLMRR